MATAPNFALTRLGNSRCAVLFLQFTYLQALDILTTLAFLLGGVAEGNPLVKLAIRATASPLLGLISVKVFALMLGAFCWARGRTQLLQRANVFFALLVAWNLVCLIVGLATRVR